MFKNVVKCLKHSIFRAEIFGKFSFEILMKLLVSQDYSGYEHTWALDSLVVVRINAHFLLLGRVWILTAVQSLELVVALEVRPSPDTTVDDVGQSLPV